MVTVSQGSDPRSPNAKTPAYLRFRIDGAKGTAWVDDVRIEELEDMK